ncbi:hypothetical protein FB645_004127 [Coemansia sp. IMI 203386]|nr:hypothetical protein FB645_004127 [Coemansia sp. IMI 203386]
MSYPNYPGHGHANSHAYGGHGAPSGHPPHEGYQQGSSCCQGGNCSAPPMHQMSGQRPPPHMPFQGGMGPGSSGGCGPGGCPSSGGGHHQMHEQPRPSGYSGSSPLGPVVFRSSASGKGDDIQEWRRCNM